MADDSLRQELLASTLGLGFQEDDIQRALKKLGGLSRLTFQQHQNDLLDHLCTDAPESAELAEEEEDEEGGGG